MASTTYPYSRLDLAKNSIRLLTIQGGGPFGDVICRLFESYPDQDRGPAFQALSYHWGDVEHDPHPDAFMPRVLVDGCQVKMTESLYAALRQIRHLDHDVTLWVDAICINQEDPEEKGHQVSYMRDVYKGAEEVLIWLGPGNGDTDSLLESISWIDAKATETQSGGNAEDWATLCRRSLTQRPRGLVLDGGSREAQALAELLARPWFTRIWVLQEVANAKTARILCGSQSCPARTFALMPSLLGLRVAEHTQAVLDIMPRIRKNTWWSSSPSRSLHSLLQKFAESQSSVPRDKVYALLGMSEDACDSSRFYPCYKKPDSEVSRDTASFLLFGEMLDSNYSLPTFGFTDLFVPGSQLAQTTLRWALGQRGRRRNKAMNTAELLVRRINEGAFQAADVLLRLATEHAPDQVGQLQNALSLGEVRLGVTFGDTRDTLTITPKQGAPYAPAGPTTHPSLVFTSPVSPDLWGFDWLKVSEDKLGILSRGEFRPMPELLETGGSKEERLWAYVWAGDTDAVRRCLKMGGDVNHKFSPWSTTLLDLAAFRRSPEMLNLLLENGADPRLTLSAWRPIGLSWV
jgi:hypothetical protein